MSYKSVVFVSSGRIFHKPWQNIFWENKVVGLVFWSDVGVCWLCDLPAECWPFGLGTGPVEELAQEEDKWLTEEPTRPGKHRLLKSPLLIYKWRNEEPHENIS